jgi:hypothetical protein
MTHDDVERQRRAAMGKMSHAHPIEIEPNGEQVHFSVRKSGPNA